MESFRCSEWLAEMANAIQKQNDQWDARIQGLEDGAAWGTQMTPEQAVADAQAKMKTGLAGVADQAKTLTNDMKAAQVKATEKPVWSYNGKVYETKDDMTAAIKADAIAEAAKAQDQQNTLKKLQGIFTQYNLTSLYSKIEEYVKQGYSSDTIQVMLRDTAEYKDRFPAMAELAKKGRAISEASYIDYERTAAQLETQYGLPKGMLMGNVTKLLTGDVSATEMAERVQLASANSLMAPKELKQTLQDYYGIGNGGLTAYFLDPAVAEPLLQKQAASARIGSEALRQGIGLDVYGAENLQSLGITQDTAKQGFQQIAGLQELTSGAGDVTNNQEMVAGLLAGDQGAVAGLQRTAGSRVARFQQGGSFLSDKGGASGLGSAAT